jgi:hypothetical protein
MKLSQQFIGVLVLALTGTVSAQKIQSPDVLLKAATTRELVDGDLTGAIAQYKDIAAKYANNHAVAARALLQLGEAYQKIGTGDARAIFARIVRDFTDQQEVAAAARARLAALAPLKAQTGDLPPRRVYTDSSGGNTSSNYTSISADGRLAVGNRIESRYRKLADGPDHSVDRRIAFGIWECRRLFIRWAAGRL